MSGWHIHCSKCGDVVGVWPDDLRGIRRDNIHPMLHCPGRGKHPRPGVAAAYAHCCLVEEFFFHYPETNTKEHAYRYIGPPWWPFLLLAFLFVVKREPNEQYKKMRVSGKVVVWLPLQRASWKELRRYFASLKD